MGQTDDFVRHQAQSVLEPGEQPWAMGLLMKPTWSGPRPNTPTFNPFLAVATDRRLITFLSEVDMTLGMFSTLKTKPIAKEVRIFRYDELAQVRVSSLNYNYGSQVLLSLVPHPLCGPYPVSEGSVDFQVSTEYWIFPDAGGFDGHPQFFQGFPQWIRERVTAGAFSMAPERWGAIQVEVQRRLALHQQKQTANKAASDALLVKVLPFVGALLILGMFGLAFVAYEDLNSYLGYEADLDYLRASVEIAKADLKRAESGKKPKKDCPERELEDPETRSLRYETCHSCSVVDEEPGREEADRQIVFERGGEYWVCPDADLLAGWLASRKEKVDDIEDSKDAAFEGAVTWCVAAFSSLALGIAALGFHRVLKRRRGAAGGTGPAAPPVQPA